MSDLLKASPVAPPASETAVKRGIQGRVNGEKREQEVKNLFQLRRSHHRFSSRPDILDYEKGVVGEVKSAKKGTRVVLYVDQIKRYFELAEELNTTALFDGAMKNFEVSYFIGFYKESDKMLTDIYILGRQKLETLLSELEPRNTTWNIVDKKILRELGALRDGSQTSLKAAPKRELTANVLRRNLRGRYIRIGNKELDKLCPNVSEIQNSIPVKIHF